MCFLNQHSRIPDKVHGGNMRILSLPQTQIHCCLCCFIIYFMLEIALVARNSENYYAHWRGGDRTQHDAWGNEGLFPSLLAQVEHMVQLTCLNPSLLKSSLTGHLLTPILPLKIELKFFPQHLLIFYCQKADSLCGGIINTCG